MKIKNAVALAVMLGGGIALNAQESKMPAPVSLSGLVSEVEDFMDVNAFQDVTFEKVFVYAGWSDTDDDSSTSNVFNIGAAKNFGSIYTALFFNADFTGFTNTITSTTYTNGSKTSSATGAANDSKGFAISALVGFGNIGIKGSVLFKNSGSTSNTGTTTTSSNNDTAYTTTTWTQQYELYPEIRAGMNLELGDLALSPYAYFGLDFNPNYTSTKTTYTKPNSYTYFTKSDKSHTWILFGLGSGLDLPEGEMAAHSFAAALDFAFDTDERNTTDEITYSDTTYGTSTSTKIRGYGNSIITFTPEWSVDITPIDSVTVSFGAELPFKFTNDGTAYKATYVTGNNATNTKATPYTLSVTTAITPGFNADVVWQAAEKLGVHVGAEFTLPSFKITNSTTYGENYTTNNHTFEFNPGSSDFDIEWDTGLRFDLTKNVIFDASWNIIGDLFTNFTNDPTNSGATTNFWDVVGKTFFHSASFLIVVKL